MKVAIICDCLGEENNGTAIASMNLIRFLKSQGHDVRVVCPDEFRKGEEGFFVTPTMNFGIFNNYVKKVGVSPAKADKEVIKEAINGVDIIHIMLPFSLGLATIKLANERGIPVTAGFHMMAQNLTAYLKMNKLAPLNCAVYKFIDKNLYSKVDGIHYPTQFIRDVFERKIKRTTNGYVISNGVNAYVKKEKIEKPEELKDKFVIVSVGRYAREKSQDTLIKAIAKSRHKKDIHLILAGQGVKENAYRKLAKKLDVSTTFKFYGRKEVIDVINMSDMYVHSGDIELEGISCLEAVACGKLTIVSDSKLSATKGFAVDEKCIFKKRNAKDLARVIDYWIEHPDERELYEELYLAKAPDLNQEACMQKMEKMMYEVIEKKNEKKN